MNESSTQGTQPGRDGQSDELLQQDVDQLYLSLGQVALNDPQAEDVAGPASFGLGDDLQEIGSGE